MITLAGAGAMGVWADRAWGCPVLLWAVVLLLGVWRLRRSEGLVRWGWVLVMVAAALALRAQGDQRHYRSASLLQLVREEPQPAMVEGEIVGLVQRRPRVGQELRPDRSPWQTLFDVQVRAVRDQQRWVAATGRLAVTVEQEAPGLRSGDAVRLAGMLTAFSPPTNPGEADFRQVARNHRQHGRLRVESLAQVRVIAPAGVGPWRLADQLSRRGEATLRQSLGERTGAIAAALVVGRRAAIESELQDRLLETGTIHLLSVSGLHLGIVAMVLTYLAVLCGLRPLAQVIFVGVLCLAFAAITGARPPVLRAASLVSVVLLARVCGRQHAPLNSLGLAALMLMWINPTNLTQVGVQLSFLSVATLFCCGQRYSPLDAELQAEARLDRLVQSVQSVQSPLRRWLGAVGGWLNNALWFSLCVTLTTAPLIWLHFHIVSPIAVLANVLMALPMTVALVSGLAAVVFGELGGWIAAPFAAVCHGALWLMQVVVEGASEVPGGHFWLPAPPTWWVAGYYVSLVAGLALLRPAVRRAAFVAGSLLWCAVAWGLAVWPAQQRSDTLQAMFIDVGHGTSVVVRWPDGRNLLYDGGWLGNDRYAAHGIQEALWSLGLTRLDAIVISHADADHYNALPALLRRFGVGEVIVAEGMLDLPKPGLEPVRQGIARSGVPLREVSAADQPVDWAGKMMILHPPPGGVEGSDNANSVVLRVDHRGRSLLLPGDLEPPGLQQVLALPRPPPGGVLMAPHHGSLTVDSGAILDWARPREVIVSGGRRALRPEVEQALQVRGSGVHITARDGAIRATLTPAGWRIEHWRTDPW